MTDDRKNRLPDAERIIAAAATVSGKPPGDLNLEQAIDILLNTDPETARAEILHRAAEVGAAAIFSDGMTDTEAASLEAAAQQIIDTIDYLKDLDERERLLNDILRKQIAEKAAAAMQPPLIGAALSDMIAEQNKRFADAITKPIQEAARAAISPAFDAIMQQQQEEHNRILAEAMRSPAIEAIQEMTRQTQEMLQGLSKTIAPTIGAMQSYFNSDAWKSIRQTLAEIAEAAPVWLAIAEEITELTPYLEAELQKPEYEGKSIDELFDTAETDDNGNPTEKSLFMQALTASRAARDADAKTPKIAAKSVQQYPVTLDKVNTVVVFDFLRKIDPTGQITMLPLKMESSKSKRPLTAYYSLYFADDLPPEIAKKLTPFDRLVYGATAAVQGQNGDVMSISQIHRAMGNSSDPNNRQKKKIHDSIVKMNAAHISLDCTEERQAYNNNAFIDYYGSLYPMEMQRAYINGQLVEGAIHLLREELPLMSVAKGRNHQLEEVPIELLDSKLNQTDPNIAMQFYVLETILRLKNGKRATRNKILYSTLYEKMGANTDKKKQRAKQAFFKYLDELIAKGFITAYKEETTKSTGETGVKFEWNKPPVKK